MRGTLQCVRVSNRTRRSSDICMGHVHRTDHHPFPQACTQMWLDVQGPDNRQKSKKECTIISTLKFPYERKVFFNFKGNPQEKQTTMQTKMHCLCEVDIT